MKIPFLKMQACGNDYVYWDLTDEVNFPDWRDVVQANAAAICNRHLGVGADGVVVLYRSTRGVEMAMFNADGSEGATCGNALRCVAWILHHRHGLALPTTVYTAAGETVLSTAALPLFGVAANTQSPTATVCECGAPTIAQVSTTGDVSHGTPEALALTVTPTSAADTSSSCYSVRFCSVRVLGERRVYLSGRGYRYRKIDVGNLHAVVAGCSLPVERVHEAICRKEGRDINVETYVAAQGVLHASVCERGSGVTLACGSGACAVAIAARCNGDAVSPVCVQMAGGKLYVRLERDAAILSGEAVFVFEGVYEIARGN